LADCVAAFLIHAGHARVGYATGSVLRLGSAVKKLRKQPEAFQYACDVAIHRRLHFSACCGERIMLAGEVTLEIATFFLEDFLNNPICSRIPLASQQNATFCVGKWCMKAHLATVTASAAAMVGRAAPSWSFCNAYFRWF